MGESHRPRTNTESQSSLSSPSPPGGLPEATGAVEVPVTGGPASAANTSVQSLPASRSTAAAGTTEGDGQSVATGSPSVVGLLQDPDFRMKFRANDPAAVIAYREALAHEDADAKEAELARRTEAARQLLCTEHAEVAQHAQQRQAAQALDRLRAKTPKLLRAIGAAYVGGGSVPRALHALQDHEREILTFQRLAAPTSSYRPGKLVEQAQRYLLLRADMRAELDVPMTMRQRHELIRSFETDEGP